jgi:hypothetical protein
MAFARRPAEAQFQTRLVLRFSFPLTFGASRTLSTAACSRGSVSRQLLTFSCQLTFSGLSSVPIGLGPTCVCLGHRCLLFHGHRFLATLDHL